MRKILLLTCAVLALFTGCKKHQESSVEDVLKKHRNAECEISYKRQVYDALVAQNKAHLEKFELYSDIRDEYVEVKSYEEFCDLTADSNNFYWVRANLIDYGYKVTQFKKKWQSYDSLTVQNKYKVSSIDGTIYMDLDKVVHKTLDCPFFGFRRNKYAYKEFTTIIYRNEVNTYADGYKPIFYSSLDFGEIFYCNYCLSKKNKSYITHGRVFY